MAQLTHQFLARLEKLHALCDPEEPWRIESEPHDHADGTVHFTHVRAMGHDIYGAPTTVEIGQYVTHELAELLVLMRNNLPELLALAEKGLEGQTP